MPIRIALTGGGSGGHIYPLIAVSEELQTLAVSLKTGVEIRYFGNPGEYSELFEASGISMSKIASGKLRRYFSLLNFLDSFKFLYAFFQAWIKLFFYMPDVIFSKGGSGALPVIIAGRFYRIPVIIHESDSIPGRTNFISARFASRIAVSFAEAAEYFKERGFHNIALTGNPVRPSLLRSRQMSQNDAKYSLGFDSSNPLIFVIGGSQGAHHINDFIVNNLRFITEKYQILHQTGIRHYSEVIERTKTAGAAYKAVPYIDDMAQAFSASDIVVSRAGAGSIFEIAAFGKPAILVPLPANVVGEHQIRNAYAFADTGAAIVVEEENLLNNIFLAEAAKIIGDPNKKKAMSEASKKFYKPNASRIIAEEILKLTRQ